MLADYNVKDIPVDICIKLDDLRNGFGESYTTVLDEDGFGFTATPIPDDDGNYSVYDMEYHFTADIAEDDTWQIFWEHKGVKPGCFWTGLEEF